MYGEEQRDVGLDGRFPAFCGQGVREMHGIQQSKEDTGNGEKRFRTEFFGFDRVEVLTYIERISAANAEKARALEDTITALQKDLYDAQGRSSTLERKADQVFTELETEKKRAEEAKAEADALRAEVKKANDEIAAVRSRLFARDQENATLKHDNARLTETVDDLTRALSQRGTPPPEKPVYRRPAVSVSREKERAEAQRARLQALREQLAAVDAKILEATGELQRATDGITAALEGVWTDSPPAALSPEKKDIAAPEPDAVWPAPTAAVPSADEPLRSQYRATNGRPLPGRNVTPQGDRPPELQEQYDAVQHAARALPPEVAERIEEPPVQVVDIPQVPPKKEPDSDAQIPFGKPHAPRAMPFAPFDPYSPHTAPYIEPGTEAARILNTPPPPPLTAAAKKPYVPQPTPIRTAPSLSEPLLQPAATALAGLPQVQSKRAAAAEPVIIPYSMPIPPPVPAGANKDGAGGSTPLIPFRDGWERAVPHTSSLQEQESRGSALSEDLLNHLNRLINGEKKP